jgi:hypothetical protein
MSNPIQKRCETEVWFKSYSIIIIIHINSSINNELKLETISSNFYFTTLLLVDLGLVTSQHPRERCIDE